MAQNKLERFAQLKTFPNVFEYPQDMKGKWADYFQNENAITLELACGKGEYAVGLGRLHPNKNFIGIDIKGNRMWVGAKAAMSDGLSNVAFIRSQIEKITDYFAEGEVEEIWITFPDPQLRISKAKKRLTHPRFLRLYQAFIGKRGIINLKTDSPDLFNFTKQVIQLYNLETLAEYDDVYAKDALSDDLKIQTHYEKLDIAQSNRIHYLRFRINQELPTEIDEQLKQLVIETESD